jgi:hypothetical protein
MNGATPFAQLTKTQRSDMSKAKAAMSTRYLAGQIAVQGLARSFRAAPSAARTHNVVGVGIDEKYVDGVPCGVSVVKFLVRTKMATTALSASERLPKAIDGIPTDVEEVGLIVPLAKKKKKAAKKAGGQDEVMPNPRTRLRPAQPGCSVGFREPNDDFVMAGTFGLLVKDAAGTYILSNNHVIAFENGIEMDGTRRTALKKGAPIFQPGLLDGGSIATDQIATLTRWIDLKANTQNNLVDGAIAELLKKSLATRDILFIGAPNGTAAAAKDMIVHKFGRTTSYTAGRVSSVFFDVTVPYEVGDVMFQDQIAIRGLDGTRFSDSGDSGSGILERSTNKVVGLLFAGATNGSLTFANHIGDVLTKLKVKLA